MEAMAFTAESGLLKTTSSLNKELLETTNKSLQDENVRIKTPSSIFKIIFFIVVDFKRLY
jgi:hypothetical protein